ncbi:hypothetical protein PVAP13_5KG216200 [Panicum virgatum]|uniref:Uncharacterized protein n=1 Tax=Panicum virgatum TaxID=38727 RepID=A0A8T0SJ97_PANVG|nr:hypothetical protein PVAP13_5KG216200 [Panicum virgatum]
MAGHGNKNIFLCPGEEIARGLIFFAPGSPPPLVSLSPLLCVLRCSSSLRYSCIATAKIWSSSDTPKRVSKLLYAAIIKNIHTYEKRRLP